MILATDDDDDTLPAMLATLAKDELVAVAAEIAGLACVIWGTRADSTAVREALQIYAEQLAARAGP